MDPPPLNSRAWIVPNKKQTKRKKNLPLGVFVYPLILELGNCRQEEQKFKASLGCIVRLAWAT